MCCTGMEYGPSTCFVLTILEEQLQQAVIDAMNIVFGREMLPIIDALADFGNYYKTIVD